ncbi:hypothetical protein H5410_042403, partial [Solanum commersonii]
MHVVEMGKLRNEDIRNKVDVTSVIDKMRKVRLRWLEHVKRRCIDTPGEAIRHDMAQLQVTEYMTLDKRVWMSHIKVE